MTVFLMTIKRILRQPVCWAAIAFFPIVFSMIISASKGGWGDTGASDRPDVSVNTMDVSLGVSDKDATVLSGALVSQLKKRFDVTEVAEEDISAKLTDAALSWVLLIPKGYESDILAGRAPRLDGYSLGVSDVSALGNVNAQNITRALMLLGTNDPEAVAAWEEASSVKFTETKTDGWAETSYWFGFFGMIAMFTAYFVIKTLLEDRRGGMPDRLGVLAHSPRTHLISSSLAAFAATEISVLLLMAVLQALLGGIPNPLHLFALLSLYNLFAVCMVLAITSMAKNLGAASVVITMGAVIFAMLGGLFWPLDIVPEFMKKVAWFSPGYWLSQGLANIKDITFEGFGLPVLFLGCFAVVAIVLGGWKSIGKMEE
ncbi:MAG: ABC transporter permease [Oscillospiraceae bacterium]|jgi:ABC-2 type transport system permease protein|nr:ABC transporter permease [Oscillospiraceae bacterium]